MMGSGESGRYYTSHGSNRVHHGALIHSFDGRFSRNPRTGKIQSIKSGGHGQSALDVMDRNGIKYNIVKTYANGVRVGNIPSIHSKLKKTGTGMAWFPKSWTQRDMVRAGEHVSMLKHNRGVKDGVTIWGVYKGVRFLMMPMKNVFPPHVMKICEYKKVRIGKTDAHFCMRR